MQKTIGCPDGYYLRELDEETYKLTPLLFQYETDAYYDVERNPANFFEIKLVRKFITPRISKEFTGHLFSDYLESPSAFAFLLQQTHVAFLQLSREVWHNRLRIAELLVLPEHRGKGLGKLLIDKAKNIAQVENFREIVLETQTCNTKAIDFYMANGFVVNGIDLTHYSNHDIEQHEVRLEMTYLVEGNISHDDH